MTIIEAFLFLLFQSCDVVLKRRFELLSFFYNYYSIKHFMTP